MSEIPKGFDKLKGKLTEAELVRIGIIAELDAINLYEQLAARAKSKIVKETFKEIANEEKVHVGEFLELLKELDPEQVKAIKEGTEEVNEKK